MPIKERCREVYNQTYNDRKRSLYDDAVAASRRGIVSDDKLKNIETNAQKEAIKQATILTIRDYPHVEASTIWKAVYEVHIHRKSGIDDSDVISKVISADQSWKKSSGHAFEEMIKTLASAALSGTGIEIVLQKELSVLIKANEIANEPRDISWLKEQIKASIFDLYAVIQTTEGKKCFGCIQSKTSIRDRVTRDREPSIQAMQSYFWSTVIVLDGDFLRNPKFVGMVNGGTVEHPTNGWHGMYVFSEQYTQGRIYPTNLDFVNFKEHAIEAANYWLTQRQWFDTNWTIEN